jgi:hypothetical protein
VKKSWGSEYGSNIYVKVLKDKSIHCEIATSASYPTMWAVDGGNR